jgi:hypothetical protein
MGNFFRLSLKGKVIGLVFCFFLMSSLVTGLVIRGTVIPMFEKSMAEDAMDIALSVAHIPGIIDNVGRTGGAEVIQPIADGIRRKTGTEFVVVIDTDGIRYSHKVPERIGKRVVGGDEGRSLLGEAYVSRAVGTLGPSLRAFAPIYRNGELVGAVLVGILIDRVNAETWRLTTNVLMALALGLVVGIVGATVLADGVKQSMRGFEPEEIDRFLWERGDPGRGRDRQGNPRKRRGSAALGASRFGRDRASGGRSRPEQPSSSGVEFRRSRIRQRAGVGERQDTYQQGAHSMSGKNGWSRGQFQGYVRGHFDGGGADRCQTLRRCLEGEKPRVSE